MKDSLGRTQPGQSSREIQPTEPIEAPRAWRNVPILERRGDERAVPQRNPAVDCRRETRTEVALVVNTSSIDPLSDPITGRSCYQASHSDITLNLSRRGVCLRCATPPSVGARLLLEIQMPGEDSPVEVVGRTCWARVEFVPGEKGGARAVARVGVELLGGSATALDRYERCLAQLRSDSEALVATSEGVG